MKKILLLGIAVLVVALVWSWAAPAKKDNRVSKTRVVALSAVSAFSPGIALLSIAYYAKRNLNARGENSWFLKWLWLFWIVDFIDVTLDKIPGAAMVNQVVEYLLIWFVAWVGATVLNSDVSMLLGGLAGSGGAAVPPGLPRRDRLCHVGRRRTGQEHDRRYRHLGFYPDPFITPAAGQEEW